MAKDLDELQSLRDSLSQSNERFERLLLAFETKASATPPSPLGLVGLSEEQQNALIRAPKPQKFRVIPGYNEERGTTFQMFVVESKAFPNGRVVRLEGYKHPDGIDRHQMQGGLVPDGHPIYNQGGGMGSEAERAASMNPLYKQWRFEHFYQADLKEVASGRSLASRFCVDPEDVKNIPWQESKVTQYDSDEAA